MPLIVVLFILLVAFGGLGFGGFVALGSLTVLVKVLFALVLLSLIVAVVRNMTASTPGPYDPTL